MMRGVRKKARNICRRTPAGSRTKNGWQSWKDGRTEDDGSDACFTTSLVWYIQHHDVNKLP
eukprot:scaffold1803_cov92-Amphora_coffeaeformis.AAC.35